MTAERRRMVDPSDVCSAADGSGDLENAGRERSTLGSISEAYWKLLRKIGRRGA